MTSTSASCKQRIFVLLAAASAIILNQANATTYNVAPGGSGTPDEGSSGEYDLTEALALAKAGDTISLADGTYDEAIVTVTDGSDGSPITIVGGPGAVINGDHSERNVLIQHSFITLEVSRSPL